MENFEAKLQSFVAGCKSISDADIDRWHPNNPKYDFTATDGKRYVRVVRGVSPHNRGVHCFVDKTNGDVLKAAGWKVPAKHARGNIFADDNGLSRMGPHGPEYLR